MAIPGANEIPVSFAEIVIPTLPYYFQSTTPAGSVKLQDLPGRIVVLGEFRTTEPTSPAATVRRYRVALYEIPCASLVWDATEKAFRAKIPTYISALSDSVLFVVAENGTDTDTVIGLSPSIVTA